MNEPSTPLTIKDLKLLIIEDDISFATGVEIKMESLGIYRIATANTEATAIDRISDFHPDLALVDIRLDQDSDNVNVFQYLKLNCIPFIVMTQFKEEDLYKNIARHTPLAYLTKPLDYFALKYAIDAYFFRSNGEENRNELESERNDPFLYVKKGNKYLKVFFDHILFIQAEGNYITIHTHSARYVVRSSLKKSWNILPRELFIQVHRNYVVGHRHVEQFDSENNTLSLRDMKIPVGRSFKPVIRKFLNIYK